jgi:hypothetical protein
VHRQIRLAPFPGKGFARHISVFTTEMTDTAAARTVNETMRRLLETRALAQVHEAMPWLTDLFRLLPATPE